VTASGGAGRTGLEPVAVGGGADAETGASRVGESSARTASVTAAPVDGGGVEAGGVRGLGAGTGRTLPGPGRGGDEAGRRLAGGGLVVAVTGVEREDGDPDRSAFEAGRGPISGAARGGLEGVARAALLAGRSLGVLARAPPGGGVGAAELGAALAARVVVAAGALVAGRSTARVAGARVPCARVAALVTASLAAAFPVTAGAASLATDRVLAPAGVAPRSGAALADTGRTELLDRGGMDRASERSATPPGAGELAG